MRIICDIRPEIIEKEFGQLNTNEVVLTDERAAHIQERHPQDYAYFEEWGKATIEQPDIIIKDLANEDTVFMVSRLPDTNLNTVIRLSVAQKDDEKKKNSIMTFYRIRTKNLEKLMQKNKVLYNGEKS